MADETVDYGPDQRARLAALRAEAKFEPHDFPPLGYVGPDLPEDGEDLSLIVNTALDEILALEGSVLQARDVRPRLHRAVEEADLFATEDRDRVWGYCLEIWCILGFRVALFLEGSGAAFQPPPGYAEPLPPGWMSPDQPRPISPSR